jgi:hypothetical protein
MTGSKYLARVSPMFVIALFAGFVARAAADSPKSPVPAVNATDGTGVKGFDPVAYFTLGHPTPGVDQYTYRWRQVTYRFASAENREKFKAAPRAVPSPVRWLLCLRHVYQPDCRHRSVSMGDRQS